MSVRDEILSFLRDPRVFADDAQDPSIWVEGLERFALPSIAAKSDYALRPAQEAAWRGLADRRVGLVLGPPGTGKTHLLAWLIVGYLQARRRARLPCRVFVTAFTRNAIGNVLEAVADRFATHFPLCQRPLYLGTPLVGLSSGVEQLPRGEDESALNAIGTSAVVVGGTIWSLHRLLTSQKGNDAGGPTAPLFDLVCIDEASQMVLAHGLMALAGLGEHGRVVVAGDDQQLPPLRGARIVAIGGRELGGSLYGFLKSTGTSEFALAETFRLNGPLTAFPERKFYVGRYTSAVPQDRLALCAGWRDGLPPWQQAALDPEFPIVVFVHDGPSATTSNSFEARLAAELAKSLRARVMTEDGGECPPEKFWSKVAAIISPHRAQNSAIRLLIDEAEREVSFVETVDRIQGKERDAIVLTYTVADPEFALAEDEFIFSSERLNVAITRARTKLVVFISRRLLDAAPNEQEMMEKVELLREFVFSCEHKGELALDGPIGARIRVEVRARGFDSGIAELEVVRETEAPAVMPDMSPELESVLEAVRNLAINNAYGAPTLRDLRTALARAKDPFHECRDLHLLGHVSLYAKLGRNGPFWIARPLAQRRRVFDIDVETVRQRIEMVVREARKGTLAPFYDNVRDRFGWMTADGADGLLPVLQELQSEGLVVFDTASNGSMTIDVPRSQIEPLPENELLPVKELADSDFVILNALEDIEAKRINFGVFDGWASVGSLVGGGISANDAVAAIARLQANGYVMVATDGRVRSRMAEIAREIRHVKQRFKTGDADRRPYLVRSLKVEIRDRDKPLRNIDLADALENVATHAPEHEQAILAVLATLKKLWGAKAAIAAFQARGFEAVLSAWRGEGPDAIVVAADTGSGKTEAAVLPLIAATLSDRLAGIAGVGAILVYPRVRLVANQAQRLAGYLAALAQVPGLPVVSLGMQVGEVPRSFQRLQQWDRDSGWRDVGPNAVSFPFFGCPGCGQPLRLLPAAGKGGNDALVCTSCNWRFDGWVGSKDALVSTPPTLFLPTADSLHQWLHDPQYGVLFGDDVRFAAPRALLADEIHLYTHIHGAQVGLALQRLVARAESNAGDGRRMVAIGMSATLGEPAEAWGRLIGRDRVVMVAPRQGQKPLEIDKNPRGREYFYFVQPEVESRGQDIAGASTTIQSLMCVAHGMRRRTGAEGGFRSLVFLDSIDKLRRLHSAYRDAEEDRELASLRTRDYGDDASGQLQTVCCGEPVGCDRFGQGECWWFAANDDRQRTARGRLPVGSHLKVAERPISSRTGGDIDGLISDADIVFATSSLEVGYDDPDITLVYQHYAPQNLASFIQRKGRGGRGVDDRPITTVTLSIYSPRDTWWFRRPHEMIEPAGFEIPLNPKNFFVLRGQAVCAILDAFARAQLHGEEVFGRDGQPGEAALRQAEDLAFRLFGKIVWSDFGASGIADFWRRATNGQRFEKCTGKLRESVSWAPKLLFDTINLPSVLIEIDPRDGRDLQKEDVSLALPTIAPGNATRRFHPMAVYWRPPVHGRAPWLDPADYQSAQWLSLFDSREGLLAELPHEARAALADVDARICRPVQVRLARLGRVFGASWTPEWVADAAETAVRLADAGKDPDSVKHESRASLRGFLLIKANPAAATLLDRAPIARWVSGIESFVGGGAGSAGSGLFAAQVYWGADAQVRKQAPASDPVPFAQTFIDPARGCALLHGYQVETEGLRFKLDTARLDGFVGTEIERIRVVESEGRWQAAKFLRYLLESGAQNIRIDVFRARRWAELVVAANGDPELRKKLVRLLHYWDPEKHGQLLQETRLKVFSQHPLITERQVAQLGKALGDEAFRGLVHQALEKLKQPKAMADYLRSVVLHGLALRLRQSFILVGRGDERRVVAQVKLPIQFEGVSDDVITICESGAHGDGTTRNVLAHLDQALEHWSNGFIGGCPNAKEDEIVQRFWTMRDKHESWRGLDSRELATGEKVAGELGLSKGDSAAPATILRILFESEMVGPDKFQFYDLALEVENVRAELEAGLGRLAQDWELTSAGVVKATRNRPGATELSRLRAAYAGLDDAVDDESLGADARLADQVYRLGARLCLDGCRACVHQSSELMSDSLVEVSVSRRMLERFLCS